MSTLTVLVIARNEASVIGRCLSSLPPHDELIVVDTGSSDDTCEIAKSYGAKIAQFTWTNNFADARNFAESLATGDYVLWIDADEILAEGHQLIRDTVDEGKVISLRPAICVLIPPDGELSRPFLRQDLLHKRGSHEWRGAIHEWTEGTLGAATPAIMYHEIARPEGDKPHSWDALREAAGERSDRSLFYLASAHGALGHHVEAIALYDYMLSLPAAPNTMRARAAWMKGHILRACGDFSGATQAYLDAIYQCPDLAEPYYYLGEMFLDRGALTMAMAWLSASIPFPQQDHSYDLDVYTTLRMQKLNECMEKLNAPVPV